MSWFSKKIHETVDAITADFTAMVDKLEALASRKLQEAENAAREIIHLESVKDVATAEAAKARNVVKNISNIFNNPNKVD